MRQFYLALAFIFCAVGIAAAQNASIGGQPVEGVVVTHATSNSSQPITAGGTYQTLLTSVVSAINAQGLPVVRQAMTIQNNNTNGDNCWIFLGSGSQITPGTTTSQTSLTINGQTMVAANFSILLNAGGSYQRYWPFVPADAVFGTCQKTSDSIYVDTN